MLCSKHSPGLYPCTTRKTLLSHMTEWPCGWRGPGTKAGWWQLLSLSCRVTKGQVTALYCLLWLIFHFFFLFLAYLYYSYCFTRYLALYVFLHCLVPYCTAVILYCTIVAPPPTTPSPWHYFQETRVTVRTWNFPQVEVARFKVIASQPNASLVISVPP